MKAHSQGDTNDAVEDNQAVRKQEHLEGQGDVLFEQEAQGPLHDQVGGWQAEVAEVASIKEALRKMYPKRRDISPATTAFIGTLLRIGLTKPQICRMFRKDNSLFARSSVAFLQRQKLLERHGVNAVGFLALLQRHTWWLSKSLQEVEGTILYLERLLGGPGEAAALAFTVYPCLLSCSEVKLEEKVQALQREGVHDIARVIIKDLRALSHSSQKIFETAAALKGALGPELAAAVLESRPQVLRANSDGLRELLAWLEMTFGRAAMLQMVAKHPAVTRAKVETASAVYAGLVGTFGEAHARRMLFVQPGLLPRKWCELEAKVEYVTKALGHTLDEVARWPTMLMLSLEGRLLRRAATLQAAGKAHGSLFSLLGPSDEKFEQKYGVRLRRAVAARSIASEGGGSVASGQHKLSDGVCPRGL